MDRTITDPMVGRLLEGRYLVGPRIARGGMATVYEATDLRLDRPCAVKVMHAGLGDDDDFAARFVREARSAARLSHPNVVGVFDQGDDDGTLYLAMEYVPGRTLRDLIGERAPLPPAEALRLLDPILSALTAAHGSGMIHRDVKPENVLLANDGIIKVADFGLARAVSADTQHTATGGVLIGTVSYLAPELVIDGHADARADVYAAGVLLYELLTGRKPHEGDSPIQVAYRHVHEDVSPPSQAVPGIAPYVDALVARATARERDLRPADARVLLHQVRRVRSALDHGVADDPELTADLTPLPGRRLDDDPALLRADRTPTIIEPGEALEHSTLVLGRSPGPDADTHRRQPARPAPAAVGRSRTGPVLLAVVLVLALAAGAAGWWFGAGRYAETPAVVNLTQDRAREQVEAAGLSFRVAGREHSETVPAGSVLSTDPAAGSRIADQGTVAAVVSRGPERYEVPALRGLSDTEAGEALEDVRLDVADTRRRFHPTAPAGAVLDVTPEPGTELRPGASVDLLVSKGPRPVDVPDLSGDRRSRAVRTLTGLGLEVEIVTRNHARVPEGEVISQSPNSARLLPGDVVELTVSQGPVMVEVPVVAGVGVDRATRLMQEAGLRVRTETSSLYVGLEYVVETDPAEGSSVPKGSLITMYLV